MTTTEAAPESVTDALSRFRGDMPVKPPNARSLAATIENPGCNARRVFDAAGVDIRVVSERIGAPMPEEQSVFALNRGTRFEKDLKEDGYARLLELLREHGFKVHAPVVLPLRSMYPIGPRNADEMLRKRADATRDAVLRMAGGDDSAPNLIDGGALQWDFGGATARLETDGIAWRLGGRIRIIEIKSFPIVDGRGDPGKVGAAAWQAAVYVSAISDMLAAAGYDGGVLSSEILLICPKNTSLVPTLAPVDVSRQARALRRLLNGRKQVPEILAALGDDLTLNTDGMDEATAASRLADVLERLGTNYLPSCLASCPLAYHCRDRARSAGDPACVGPEVRSSLAGITSIPRVLELTSGSPATAEEAAAAEVLERASRLLRAVETGALRGAA